MKFSELVSEYVVKSDKERLRNNTHDDFGVYPKVFIGGGFADQPEPMTWLTVWGELTPELVAKVSNLMSGNQIGSLEFMRGPEGVRAKARSRDYISQFDLGAVEEFPAELEFILE